MKVVKIIRNVIIGILVVVFFSFVILMTVLMLNINPNSTLSQIGGTSYVPIKEQVSSENYKKGDLVFVEKTTIDKINVGDEIFVYRTIKGEPVTVNVGTVGEIHTKEKAISFENGSTYSMEYVLGHASKSYSNIGTYLAVIQSKWGFLFIILVPSFLIFIYELCALIIELKYGKPESYN